MPKRLRPAMGIEYHNPQTGENAQVARMESLGDDFLVFLDNKETWNASDFLRCFSPLLLPGGPTKCPG